MRDSSSPQRALEPVTSIEKTTGVILRAVDFSETSKIVTFYTRDFGKLKAMAKGGRRLKSSFEVALDLLSVCSISVIRKPAAELDLLTEALLQERFAELRRDLSALYAAYYIAEILDGLTQTGDPHPALFDTTLEALRKLGTGADWVVTLVRYQLLLFKELGYAPNLETCASCGSNVALTTRTALSHQAGGLLCPRCLSGQRDYLTVQGGTVQAMRVLTKENETIADRLVIGRQAREELWRIASSSIAFLLGRRPRMAAMLHL